MPPKPEAQLFLDGLAVLDLPAFESMDAATQRSIFDAENPDGPPAPPIASVRDTTAGGVPVRVYKPSDDTGLPVVVYFHGGGWVLGNLDSHDNTCRAIANAASSVVVAVDYRRAPEDTFPAAFDDCVAAVAWVAANAGDLGIDASRIAVAGDSAGGNLAAAAALWARDNADVNVAAQVLIYPAVNLADPVTDSYNNNADGYLLTKGWMNWFIDQYLGDADRSQPFASPALAESHAGLAPAIVITAEFDPLHDDGKNYADALSAAGVTVQYEDFDGQIHGFATQIGVMADADVAVDQIASFLAANW